MVSKTREKLIEVARQLFVNKGVENTTMNDIATASDKGRRTIYTYFKNKREIYNAVIESQSNELINALRVIVESDTNPIDKLRLYLEKRFEMMADLSASKSRHDRYRLLFSRDSRRTNKISEVAREKGAKLFARLIAEGVESGVFDANQANRIPSIVAALFASLEHFPSTNAEAMADLQSEHNQHNIIDFIIQGITNNQ